MIVAVLAQTALKRYGLLAVAMRHARMPRLRKPATAAPTAKPIPRQQLPRNALERARGVEAAVRQQAEDLGKKIDDAAK